MGKKDNVDENGLPPGREYRGPAGFLKDSRFLIAEMLPLLPGDGRDIEVTVQSVMVREDLEMGIERRRVDVLGSLKFVGKKKELGLNATNWQTMCRLFGGDTGSWYGKRILLFVDKTDRPPRKKGEPIERDVPCVRIRNKRLDQGAAKGETAPASAPDGDRPDIEWDGPKATE